MPPAAVSDDTALGLTQEDLRAIDSVRTRLYQLANSIGHLKGNAMMSHPMPTPESIQASAFVLQQNLSSLNEVMAQHAELFRRIVVHPDPMFPGRTEEQVLTSLLRKKLEPDVEQVAELAREAAAAHGIGPASFRGLAGGGWKKSRGDDEEDDDDDNEEDDDEDEDDDDDDDDDEDDENGRRAGPREPLGLGDIWADARSWCMDRIGRFILEEASDLYTKRERALGIEHVRTGLRRSLEDEDDEDDDDDDDDDDDNDNANDKKGAGGTGQGGGVGDDDDDDDVMMVDAGNASKTASSASGPAAASSVPSAESQPPPVPRGPPVEPEVLLWLAARGDTDLPRYVDIETQRAAAAAADSQRR